MAALLSQQDQAALQAIGQQERQRAIVKERIEFEKKSDQQKTQFAIDNAQSVFAALGQQNRKAFEASKALAVASAIMNTYQGATKALATYPFPFNLIAAAASIAAGFAQVSQIRAQQYSGRALGGPVMGGQTYMVGENGPELFTPQGTGSITRNGDLQGGGAPTNVTFNIQANDTAGFDQLLTERRGLITQIIRDAQSERGQRVGY
jgi:SLT domain-containing protein